jgi:hypothetical protein
MYNVAKMKEISATDNRCSRPKHTMNWKFRNKISYIHVSRNFHLYILELMCVKFYLEIKNKINS